MIDAYLARIGLDALPEPTLEGLEVLMRAHGRGIAFENLDVRLGREISVELDGVFDQLVRHGRGGYCFQLNTLFSAVLARMGIANRPLLARGLLDVQPDEIPPLTHMLLLAEWGGRQWLLDAGFGGIFIAPVPLEDGAQVASGHRLRRIGEPGSQMGEWLLEFSSAASWRAREGAGAADWYRQYSFHLTEVALSDIQQASHWTSTHKDSRFVTSNVVTKGTKAGLATLLDCDLSINGPEGREERRIESAAEYGAVLRDLFRLAISDEDVARLPTFAES